MVFVYLYDEVSIQMNEKMLGLLPGRYSLMLNERFLFRENQSIELTEFRLQSIILLHW
jgi:hypothetical protein